jgi:hypothetical protein
MHAWDWYEVRVDAADEVPFVADALLSCVASGM